MVQPLAYPRCRAVKYAEFLVVEIVDRPPCIWNGAYDFERFLEICYVSIGGRSWETQEY